MPKARTKTRRLVVGSGDIDSQTQSAQTDISSTQLLRDKTAAPDPISEEEAEVTGKTQPYASTTPAFLDKHFGHLISRFMKGKDAGQPHWYISLSIFYTFFIFGLSAWNGTFDLLGILGLCFGPHVVVYILRFFSPYK